MVDVYQPQESVSPHPLLVPCLQVPWALFLLLFVHSFTSKAWKYLVPAREGFRSVYTAVARKARNGYVLLRSPHCCLVLSPRDEVNKAYRKLAVLLHPDKCVAPGSEDAFKAVVNARTALLKNIK